MHSWLAQTLQSLGAHHPAHKSGSTASTECTLGRYQEIDPASLELMTAASNGLHFVTAGLEGHVSTRLIVHAAHARLPEW
jgi:ABC-type Fe3+-citrate transport system substrate-binding protein